MSYRELILKPQVHSPRAVGVILVVISAIVFSSAGIFTNGVSSTAWSIIFWRGLAAAGFTALYMLLRGVLVQELKLFTYPALLITVMMSLGTMAFIPAFKLSSVANVAIVYSACPFVAALLAWLFIGERPTKAVLIASCFAFVGMLIVFLSSASVGGGIGELLALFMTIMMAGAMVGYRKWPNTTVALPAVLSSLFLLPVALMFGEPMQAESSELPILVVFGLVFALASITLLEGARRLPSAETALLSLLETPLAPILAFFILREVSSASAIVGGVIIFLAVVWSQLQTHDGSKSE